MMKKKHKKNKKVIFFIFFKIFKKNSILKKKKKKLNVNLKSIFCYLLELFRIFDGEAITNGFVLNYGLPISNLYNRKFCS